MAKLPIQKIQWNIWVTCNQDDFDLEIEVPDWFEDIVRSAENSYGDIVSALDSLVKSQQTSNRIRLANQAESVDGISFLAEAGLSPEWCKREVQKHIDAGHNLTDVTTLDSDRIRFLCSCGVGLMGDFKRHPKVL